MGLSHFVIFIACKKGHFRKRFYLFIFRERGREGEREGEKHQSVVCLLLTPNYQGPGPNPRHMPGLGIEPATFWSAGQHWIHWATSVRARKGIFKANNAFVYYACVQNKKKVILSWIFYFFKFIITVNYTHLCRKLLLETCQLLGDSTLLWWCRI